MNKSKLNATVTKITEVSPGLSIFRVAPEGWDLSNFIAGQFVVLGLPGSAPRHPVSDPDEETPDPEKLIRRSYSIASSSLEKKYMEFYVTHVRSGEFTPRLFALKEGDPIFLSSKGAGVFHVNEAPDDVNLLLLATGTGLAPHISVIRSIFMCGSERKFAIIHGAAHSWDLGYRDELETLSAKCPDFSYLPTISRPQQENNHWQGETGYVQDIWNSGLVTKAWGFEPTPEDTHVFLCGNPGMVEGMIETLIKDGFKEHSRKNPGQIHSEKWW